MGLFDSLFGTGKKKKSTHRVIPKTVQESIPYTMLYKHHGTIETRPGQFTRAYNLEDINFKIAPDADQVAIFRAYGNFLNSFSSNTRFQIVIQNHAADRRASLEDIRFRLQRDDLNKYRQEMNGMLLDKLTEGNRSLAQSKYLVVNVEDDDVAHAMTTLDSIDKEIEKGIKRISPDVSVKPQKIDERLELLFSVYNQDGQSVFYNAYKEDGKTPYFNYDLLSKAGITSKDVIGPAGMEFKPNYFTLGETYGRALYLESVPTILSTEFISDLSDINCSMIVSINHQPIDTAKAMRMIKNHMTAVNAQIAANQKKAAQNGYTFDLISPDLALSQKQTRDLLDDVIGRDQKLYYISFSVCVFANTKEELEENTKMITSVANKHLCPIKTLDFQQEQGLNSTLPLCLREISTQRLYTTESASIYIPYTVETAVPGKWGYRCTGMSYINFPRMLLCTMNNGVDLTSNKRFTKGYGYFTEMESYEELLEAWDKTIREITRYSVIVENVIDKASERDVPDILCSALTDDCIARGKTIKEGGAVYDFISGLQVGIANMADCLAAIKKLVYEEKKITRQELWNAILDDFSSPENKKIQEMLIREAPKYGNDDDYVDQLIVEAYDSYIEEIEKYPNTRYNRGPIGGIRYAGTSSISANVGQGMSTMATPDGRNAFEPLAEGCSPAHNSDKNGPTAVFKSVSKLRTNKITGGVLLNQKMTPQMLSTEENRQKLELLIKTFFNRLHGYHVQYNIVSKETLIDAQKHPENHKDLIVRVAGYSAFFNVLSKKTQDDIIGRTEQSLM